MIQADQATVDDALARLPRILTGQERDPTGTMPLMLRDLGREALACFWEAFFIKAGGGRDAAGIRWADLKPATKAYGRQPDAVRKRQGERPRGLLSDSQDKRWREIYARTYNRLRGDGVADRDAAGNAAAVAWHVLKLEGAKTKMGVYGGRSLPILFKSGALANSLAPEGGPDQLLQVDPATASVTAGSNLPYAGTHHHGNPAKGIPARRLWPVNGKLPKAWQDRLLRVLEKWAPVLLTRLLQSAASRRAA